jgi:AcrR family transcriptional regulator
MFESKTDDRVLAAATEVFAEVGYRAATLREICRRGRANIAAVNYHFRDKEQLYAAVLRQAVAAAGEGLAQFAPPANDPPAEKLRHFIARFLHNLLGADRPADLLRLWAHEMLEPTPALDMAIEAAVRPVNGILGPIVAELLGPAADAAVVRDCTASVLSQCASYQNYSVAVQRIDHVDVHDPATIDHLAEHVFRFSLGGIRAWAGGGLAGDRVSRLDEEQPSEFSLSSDEKRGLAPFVRSTQRAVPAKGACSLFSEANSRLEREEPKGERP